MHIGQSDQNRCCLVCCLLLLCFFKRNALETSMSKVGQGGAAPGAAEKNYSLPSLFCSGKVLNPEFSLWVLTVRIHCLKSFIFSLGEWWAGRIKLAASAVRTVPTPAFRRLGLSSLKVLMAPGKDAPRLGWAQQAYALLWCFFGLKLQS